MQKSTIGLTGESKRAVNRLHNEIADENYVAHKRMGKQRYHRRNHGGAPCGLRQSHRRLAADAPVIGWIACCPAHNDRNPSLSISDGADGKVLVYCHTGCNQTEVIEALRAQGLWRGRCHQYSDNISKPWHHQKNAKHASEEVKRIGSASRLWRATLPAQDTLVEVYLQSRGISIPVPQALRFHPNLKHPTGTCWPGIVALVRQGRGGRCIGIHRTFLTTDGSGKAPVEPNRMMLGLCRGGAVQLGSAAEQLMVGEGIETSLAVLQATGVPVWAALSTSGMKSLDLPPKLEEVTKLADGDQAGEDAAMHAARRWVREGRHVRIAYPGEGLDFNDLLIGRSPKEEGGAA